jgi:CRP-like cAMP-binding protein
MSWLNSLTQKIALMKRPAAHHADWYERLRATPAFAGLSEPALHEVCAAMQPQSVRAGEAVVREGEEGDFYFALVEGQARVTRRSAPARDGRDEEVASPLWLSGAAGQAPRPRAPKALAANELAILNPGDVFGEEALVSNRQRNATVTMLTDGLLLRLAKEDFLRLLKEPSLRWLSAAEAAVEVSRGGVWLDVRPADDPRPLGSLPDSETLPIEELRQRIESLDRTRLYVCYCNDARLSATAAFLLTRMGYRAAVLTGGMRRLR